MLETVDHSMNSTPTRAYVMKARGDQDTPEVIIGIISLYGVEMHALTTLDLLIHMYSLSMCSIR